MQAPSPCAGLLRPPARGPDQLAPGGAQRRAQVVVPGPGARPVAGQLLGPRQPGDRLRARRAGRPPGEGAAGLARRPGRIAVDAEVVGGGGQLVPQRARRPHGQPSSPLQQPRGQGQRREDVVAGLGRPEPVVALLLGGRGGGLDLERRGGHGGGEVDEHRTVIPPRGALLNVC